MTVSSETSSVAYPTDGVTTAFPTTFRFLRNSDVTVKHTPASGVETVLVEGVHYGLTGAGVDAGGTVTTLAALAAGSLVIERTLPFKQLKELRNQGTFRPEVHEDALDEATFRDQQLDRRLKSLESAGAVGSVVAGNGLAFSGSTLHVGAGTGIQANADTVEVLFGLTPADVTKAAASTGIAGTAARSDHKHDIATAVAGAIAIGDAAAEGTATSLARSDHRHSVAAPAAPVDVTKAAASAGAATTFARADHKHDITTAVPVDLTDATNTEGAAASLARSDHTHSHGARGGGTLHANVVSGGAAGFMTGADKAKLDALPGSSAEVLAVSPPTKTTDATPTTILTWTPTNDTGEAVEVIVAVKQTGSAFGGAYGRAFCVVRNDNTTSQIGATQVRWPDIESAAGWDVTVTVTSPSVQVVVTGAAATPLWWRAIARRVIIPSA